MPEHITLSYAVRHATKKIDQSAVTKEPPQGYCKNVRPKKIYILKKYILRKPAA
jgi:hypothetical protein